MTSIGGWLLVPLMFLLLCVGIGLLAETAARRRVPGALLPAVGLAGLIVLAAMLTIVDATAEFAAPACAVAAVAGLVLGRPWRDPRLRAAFPWAAVCAGLAFVIVSLPAWLSGHGLVLGYIKLDDSAIWLGLIEHIMIHGRDIDLVPPSTFQLDLVNWLDQGYPIGSFMPVGVVAKLTGQEYVNAYQTVISCFVAVTALGLYAIARELVASARAAAAVAVIGVQASLFFGYVAWGSVKEICLAALLPALVALRVLPLTALVAGAVLLTFGIGGLVFVGPALLIAAILALAPRPRRSALISAAIGAVVLVVAVIPQVVVVGRNTDQLLNGAPSAQDDLGKLFEPLDLIQGAGLWPAGDFRVDPDPRKLAVLLALLVLVLAAGAFVLAVHRRSWALPALLATCLVGGGVAIARGGPWIDAKVLAVVSPMLLAAAASLVAAGRRMPVAWVGAVILVAGCAWSSFLVNRDVFVSPRDNITEQRDLADRIADLQPALMLDYDAYSTRYFLWRSQVEGATDLRVNLIPGKNGQVFPDFSTVEIDNLQGGVLPGYEVVVRRSTPTGSRPPLYFHQVWDGEYLEAWARDPKLTAPLAHLDRSLGILPAAQVTCREVRDLAATPDATEIAAVPRVNPAVVDFASGKLPPEWRKVGRQVVPVGNATARIELTVPRAARYYVWVGGYVLDGLKVSVDGDVVGSKRHEPDSSAGYMRFGDIELSPGPHEVAVTYERGAFWQAGRGPAGGQAPLGPIALSDTKDPPVERVPVADADKFCDGRTYDWLEALP